MMTMASEPQPPGGAPRMEHGDEAALVARALAGDRAAFGVLVERYAAPARRVARAVLADPDDADDAAQDALLAALVKLQQYDPRRPFGPWLMRIVANAATDRRRRRAVRQAEPLEPELAGGGSRAALEPGDPAPFLARVLAQAWLTRALRYEVPLWDILARWARAGIAAAAAAALVAGL